MSILHDVLAGITPPAWEFSRAAKQHLDNKTKPRGSLGRLEELACQVAAIRRSATPAPAPKAMVVMGADHGVVEEGVSAYPQAVTGQMLRNFAAGGAAINVLARQVEARVVVVDMGICEPLVPGPEAIRVHRMGPGTGNFTLGPAMTLEQAVTALEVGIGIAAELASEGVGLLGIGDMGIGNTTASSALASVLTGASPEVVTGRGTGVDDAGLKRKVLVISRALNKNRPDPTDPLDILAKVGGFEIAGLAGVVLGGAANRIPVVMDGFIASVAGLVAVRLCPGVAGYLMAAHRSVEVGHGLVLAAMDQKPLLDLQLRLGEGTGAALAMGLVDASLHILQEMATFDSARISDTGA